MQLIKTNDKTMKTYLQKSLVILLGLLVFNDSVFSQSKCELSVGTGMLEDLNIKFRYGEVFQIAISQAINFDKDGIFSAPTALEIYYHLFGKSKFIEQPPWYLFGGLTFYYPDIFLNPRFGRSFNFSKKTGINIDCGFFIQLLQVKKDPKEDLSHSLFPVFPSGSISFFIRL